MKERKLALLFADGLLAFSLLTSCAKPAFLDQANQPVEPPTPTKIPWEPTPTPITRLERISILKSDLYDSYLDVLKQYGGRDVYGEICSGSSDEEILSSTGKLNWPTSGLISQNFGTVHPAIDIASRFGTAIYAADGGKVRFKEKLDWGAGYYLLIEHGSSRFTRYSHLSEFLVAEGDMVEKKQIIGRIGSTGRSTGPHLDFEIIENIDGNCEWVNPLSLLP